MEESKADVFWRELQKFGRPFSTVDVRKVGLAIFYTRADRTARTWAEPGEWQRLIPLSEEYKKAHNLNPKLTWYKLAEVKRQITSSSQLSIFHEHAFQSAYKL